MNLFSVKTLFIFCIVLLYGALSSQAQGDIIYVKADATGANTGVSWEDAFMDLQDALSIANSLDQIWVAKGVYKPTNTTDRTISFQLKNGVGIYGGFEGNESILTQRDLSKVVEFQSFVSSTLNTDSLDKELFVSRFSATILSGDIGELENNEDNSYHVVLAESIDITTIIDALVVMDGNADMLSSNTEIMGGGIYNNNSSPSLTNCSFIKNIALNNGGGMYNFGRSRPQLRQCIFGNNQSINGGGVYNSVNSQPELRQCTFTNNEATSRGGGMYNSDSSQPELRQCTFINNQANDGGGIFSLRNTPELRQCTFTNNQAINGGGVYNLGSGQPELRQCTFTNNQAINGGGVYNSDSSRAILNQCTFTNNQADYGGGVYNFESGQSELNQCTFINNQANDGGGMLNVISNPELVQCTFTNNQAINGGGMYNLYSYPELTSCSFTKNQADYGGGIYDSVSSPILNPCSFTENQADNGGGMYNTTISDPSLTDCTFTNNRASEYGGGIHNVRSSPQLANCVFTENKADYGGGMFNLNIYQSRLNQCTFKKNLATDGGGILNIRSNPELIQCTFINNQANDGGGIANTESSPQVISCTFVANQANDGGGIYNHTSCPIVTNCTISKNEAKVNGAGVYNYKSKIQFIASSIVFNQSDNLGGGIYLKSDTAFFRNCLISNNESLLGKELYSDSSSVFLSLGHNLVRDTSYSILNSHPTDLVGNASNPMEALLDTMLRDDGAPTETYRLLQNSPALGKGESINTTTIIFDQRTFSRITGSLSDSIDIGAWEQQHTFVIPSPSKQICIGHKNQISLDDIIIADSTGGAWPANSLKSLLLEFPEGIEIISDSVEVVFEGNGFRDTSYQIRSRQIQINYKKNYSTDPHFIRLKKLKVQILEAGTYPLTRGDFGDAYQDGNGVEDKVIHASIIALPTYTVNTHPYKENFETNAGGWEGWEVAPKLKAPTWEWGSPNGIQINDAASGVFAWATDLDSTFLPDVHSWVYSPCFDIQALETPMISMNIKSDTKTDLDGAVLQVSTDNLSHWEAVGTDSTGKNWYNSNSIISNPGNQTVNAQYGWSGEDNTWRQVAHRLDNYKDQGLLRFRIAFRSTVIKHLNKQYEGFAFDDIFIGELRLKLLLEHYTNHQNPNELKYLEGLYNLYYPNLINISFALNSSTFHDDNFAAPRARALFYGNSEVENLMLNGNYFNGQVLDLTLGTIDANSFSIPTFQIRVDTILNEIEVYALDNISHRVAVYVAIIEDGLEVSSNYQVNHLLRKMLPHPGGTIYPNWPEGTSKILSLQWAKDDYPNPSIVKNYDSLKVVVFVQDLETKEVYQVEESPIWSGILDPALVNRKGELTGIQELNIYPNPANTQFWVDFPEVLETPHQLKLWNVQGALQLEKDLPVGNNRYNIQVHQLPAGIYHLELYDGENIIIRKPMMVVR